MKTPWGESQTVEQIAEGIMQVTTARHGGIKLDRKRNAQVPAYMRRPGGWYEEDCEWSIVGVTFPEFFQVGHLKASMEMLMNWNPGYSEKRFGIKVTPEMSWKRKEEEFYQKTADKLVVISASSQGEGLVECYAIIGGNQNRNTHFHTGRTFLIPSEKYQARDPLGFVIENPNDYIEQIGA